MGILFCAFKRHFSIRWSEGVQKDSSAALGRTGSTRSERHLLMGFWDRADQDRTGQDLEQEQEGMDVCRTTRIFVAARSLTC